MRKLYDFKRLINKYSNSVELLTEHEGSYIGGVWKAGLLTRDFIQGAVIPMSESKIYQSGGTLSKTDRQLYTICPIPSPLANSKIKYKDKIYSIEEDTDYSDYADAYSYVLKWVSGFDKSKTE